MKNASICLGVCAALVSFVAFAQSNDSASPPKNVITYSVKDLAVWSQNGTEFDPTILIELIKSKVSSADCQGSGGGVSLTTGYFLRSFQDQRSFVQSRLIGSLLSSHGDTLLAHASPCSCSPFSLK